MGNCSTADKADQSEYTNEKEIENSSGEPVSAIPWLSNTSQSEFQPQVISRLLADINRRRTIKLEESPQPQRFTTGEVYNRLLADTNRRVSLRQDMEKYRNSMFVSQQTSQDPDCVFNRLLEDTNRRMTVKKGLEEHKQEEIEQQEFTFKKETSSKSEAVFARLTNDAKVRKYKRHPSKPDLRESRAANRERVKESVNRLSQSRAKLQETWEQKRIEKKEKEVQDILDIVDKKHPRRKLDTKTFLRLTTPYAKKEPVFNDTPTRTLSSEETLKLLERLNFNRNRPKINKFNDTEIESLISILYANTDKNCNTPKLVDLDNFIKNKLKRPQL